MMNRKSFIQKSTLLTTGLLIMKDMFARPKDIVYGHNEMKYTIDKEWVTKHSPKIVVNVCHEMVQDKQGRIILLTNEVKNNIIILNMDGKILITYGNDFTVVHCLPIHY